MPDAPNLRAAAPFLKIPETGAPYLEGARCSACGEVFLSKSRGCAKCFAVGTLETARLASTGKLYNYTIVHRSFPGIKTPFVSAIVDLDGGGTLKGNLIDIEPTPEAIAFDMPVDVVIGDAGQTDAQGNHYLAYFFVPKGERQ